MPGMPGLPGMPAARKQPAKQPRRRAAAASPATRPSATRRSPSGAPAVDPAAAFGAGRAGLDEKALQQAMADFQLPPELRGRLGK